MRALGLVLVLLMASAGPAEARCADEAKELKARVVRAQKLNPTPQTAAAGKVLKRLDDNANRMDEVDCYNALARARRALDAPPEAPVQKKADPPPAKR